jgi:aminobenzoyl-glutamate utilization protein B
VLRHKELIAAENSKELSGFMELRLKKIAGKVYMARAGLFNDLDVCLDWHQITKIRPTCKVHKL